MQTYLRGRYGIDVDLADIPVPPNEGKLYSSPASTALHARIRASGSEYSLVYPPAVAEQPRRLISLKSNDMAPWYRRRLVAPSLTGPGVPVDLDISHFELVAVDEVSQYSYVVGTSLPTHASWLALCRRVGAELSMPLTFRSDGSEILRSAAFVAAIAALVGVAVFALIRRRQVCELPMQLGCLRLEISERVATIVVFRHFAIFALASLFLLSIVVRH